MEESFEYSKKIRKNEIEKKINLCNKFVNAFLERQTDDDFNELYFNCHMERENLKYHIYNCAMSLVKNYNLLCDKKDRKTPDIIYAPLIEECNKKLFVDIDKIMIILDERLSYLKIIF
jgi:hypothetical protein